MDAPLPAARPRRIVVPSGGIGGARFLRGLLAAAPDAEVTVIGNTADDITLFGLRICPDLDTLMYTLGGGIHVEQGWGRDQETYVVKSELAAYGAGPDWFGLGDRDLATHIVRTQMLDAGYPLSEVTTALCTRWGLAARGVRLLPMTDDRVETHVVIDEPGSGERKAVHFQEWWVRYRAEPKAQSIVPVGADEAEAGPGVVEAIAEADIVLLAPSNPVVSIGTVLAVPGVRAALRKTEASIVGISPIIDNKPVRGMADACLTAIGLETSAQAVGRHYGSRACSDNGILDGWLVHTGDTADVPSVAVRAVPLFMSDVDATAAMAKAAFDLGGVDLD